MRLTRRRTLLTLALSAVTLHAMAADWLAAPYKDASLMQDSASGLMQALKGTQAHPLLERAFPAVIWAFATGECGQERWGTVDTDLFAKTNVQAFVQARQPYIISTGGEAGSFTCGSDEGMATFLERYESPYLIGLDFDIERQQTPAQVDDLIARLAALQQRRPQLRLSFTIATHAANDGSFQSLNRLGETVLHSLRRHGLNQTILNLMVMNYGPAKPNYCVVKQGHCDMGASALQAARNVSQRYGWPLSQLALTPMLGQNDVAGNVFTLEDAHHLAQAARAMGLAGVHYWSLDRDQSCDPTEPRVSPRCHGLSMPAGAFRQTLLSPSPASFSR